MLELPPKGTRGTEIPKPVRTLIRVFASIGELMFRFGIRVQGRPLLRLGTVGARSGKSRKSVLGWFPAEGRPESWIVVASNGGAARHPGWAFNLAKNPDRATVDVGDGVVPVFVELLAGVERETAWNQVVEMAPGYRPYLKKTDRELPIFRLTKRGRTQSGEDGVGT